MEVYKNNQIYLDFPNYTFLIILNPWHLDDWLFFFALNKPDRLETNSKGYLCKV